MVSMQTFFGVYGWNVSLPMRLLHFGTHGTNNVGDTRVCKGAFLSSRGNGAMV